MKNKVKSVYLSSSYGRYGHITITRLYKIRDDGIWYIDLHRQKCGQITNLYPLQNVKVISKFRFENALKKIIGKML